MAVSAQKSGVSFVTLITKEGRPVFQISRLAELFIETLLHLRTQGLFKLHAFLVVPDRVHLLLTPRTALQSDVLDRTVAAIQQAFAERLHGPRSLWEPNFTSHPVRNLRDLENLRTYLHRTPVRLSLASSPELYPYSSAHRVDRKIAPLPTTTFTSQAAS